MRKSSRGNPNHYPAGSPKGGRFAPKGVNGVVVVDNSPEYYEKRTAERLGLSKEQQAEILAFANPADDDYHTWIRSADDIQTFAELQSEANGEIAPDYTEEDYSKALESGYITVYWGLKLLYYAQKRLSGAGERTPASKAEG